MLTLNDVSVSRQQHLILNHLNVSIPAHQITTIIGPNGSGKSTLLKTLLRLLPYENGHIQLNKRSLQAYSAQEMAKQMAYMPQLREVVSVTVEQFVAAGRYPHRSFWQSWSLEEQQRLTEVLEQLDLIDYRHTYLSELSGGERQRVYLALMLVQDAPLLLFDEPTTYLDLHHQFELLTTVQSLKTQGKTLLLVLHDLSLALQFSDFLIVMDEGTCVFQGTPSQLLETSILETIFKVKPITCSYEQQTYIHFINIKA